MPWNWDDMKIGMPWNWDMKIGMPWNWDDMKIGRQKHFVHVGERKVKQIQTDWSIKTVSHPTDPLKRQQQLARL